MSNAILPSFPGLDWGATKQPMWATHVADAVSGRQYTLARRLYPLWNFSTPYAVLRASLLLTEQQQMIGFINARKGRYDDFLYTDPNDNAVTEQVFGVGNGSSTVFELARAFGGFVEPVGAVNSGTLQVFAAGVLQSGYTLSADLRVVTFAVAPAAGVVLTWSGSFYYRCRFVSDAISFQELIKAGWKASFEFRTFRA